MAVTTTSSPQQQVNFPAVDLRQMFGTGIAGAGVRVSTDLLVAQHAAGANMSVDIAPGSAAIADTHAGGGGFYSYTLAATATMVIAPADATNPRVDRVVIRVRDLALGDVANDQGPFVVTGTPSVGATLANLNGVGAVPGSSLLSANVLVPAAAASVVTANIDSTGASNNSPAVRPLVSMVLGSISNAGVPAGAMFSYGAAAAPTGFLICDGSAVSQTTYAALYAVIGFTYGNPGSGNFTLPDGRGRVLVGFAASGGHVDVNTVGKNDGSALSARRPKHYHTVSDPGHGHTIRLSTAAGGSSGDVCPGGGGTITTISTPINTATTGITVGASGSGPVDTAPYLVTNTIIKT